MDGMALGTGLFGVLVGAGALYLVMKRNWWGVIGFLSIGAAGMLDMVTEGPRPHPERAVVSAVVYALMVSCVVAAIVQQRQARRRRAAARRP